LEAVVFYRSPVQKTQGFSLIELLLVLGVLAILLLAAFVVYPQVSLKNKVNKDLLNIQAAVAMFQSTYGVRGDYAGLDATTFAAMPNFPKELVDPTKASGLGTLMGGTLYFSGTGPDPVNPAVGRQNRLMIQITGMPPEVCVPFSTAAARMANGDLFVSGSRGGTGLVSADKRWDGKDPGVLVQRCAVATPRYVLTFFVQ
jgi:prepilin-type N-terminal cleavage/methylation domain-containing protein